MIDDTGKKIGPILQSELEKRIEFVLASFNNEVKLFKIKESGIIDRSKYSRKSYVIADFTPVEEGYSVNRLYTIMLCSLGAMSFILITYGLHGGALWPGAAIDPINQYLFIPVNNIPWILRNLIFSKEAFTSFPDEIKSYHDIYIKKC